MGTTEPIRNLEELEQLKEYYKKTHPNMRNFLLIHMGVNTALRISDLLSLTWNDVYNFTARQFRTHITLVEQKTNKKNIVALSQATIELLKLYQNSSSAMHGDSYLFPGKTKNRPLSRSQAFRILKKASMELHFEKPVSCHSLRKTFGYHAWQAGISSVMLMEIYQHSDFQITKRYLGIEQDDRDSVFLKIQL